MPEGPRLRRPEFPLTLWIDFCALAGQPCPLLGSAPACGLAERWRGQRRAVAPRAWHRNGGLQR
eukprot:2341849-Lingulodinium_polyedra.AAC.1